MHRGGAAIFLMLTASCASVDKALLDANLPKPPSQWTADEAIAAEVPTGDWVAAFDSPVLHSLIAEAMSNNNNLLSAAANLESARAGSKIARAALLPQFNISGNAGRSAIVIDPATAAQSGGGLGGNDPEDDLSGLRANELEDRFGIDVDNDGRIDGLDTNLDNELDRPLPNRRIYINNYVAGAQISWELDLWGRLSDETRAAYKDARASLADLRGAQLSIAAAVAQAWFSLIEARQQRELADRDVEARNRNLRITERRYDRGVASSLDLRLSRSALGSSQASQAQQMRLEKEAARRLEVLLGRYPAAEIEAAARLPELPALSGAGAPGDLLARRPDVVAAELRMESAGLRARAARKQMLPSLTLSSGLNTSGPELADLIDPERLAGNIAAGLFQPVFQGGRVRANANRQRALAQSSLLDYAQTALEAYEEAENALAAEELLAARENALKLAFEEAEAAESLTERRYASGASTIFNLLDAQTRRISSESAYISAQQQRVTNRVQLYLAIGGDFLTDTDLTIPAETIAKSNSTTSEPTTSDLKLAQDAKE